MYPIQTHKNTLINCYSAFCKICLGTGSWCKIMPLQRQMGAECSCTALLIVARGPFVNGTTCSEMRGTQSAAQRSGFPKINRRFGREGWLRGLRRSCSRKSLSVRDGGGPEKAGAGKEARERGRNGEKSEQERGCKGQSETWGMEAKNSPAWTETRQRWIGNIFLNVEGS